jgi:hypothetical protein
MFGEKKLGGRLRSYLGGQRERARFARFMREIFKDGRAKKEEVAALRKGDETAQRIAVSREALSPSGVRDSLVRNDRGEGP